MNSMQQKALNRLKQLNNKLVYVKDRYTSGYYTLRISGNKYYLYSASHSGSFEFRDVAWVEHEQINLRPT